MPLRNKLIHVFEQILFLSFCLKKNRAPRGLACHPFMRVIISLLVCHSLSCQCIARRSLVQKIASAPPSVPFMQSETPSRKNLLVPSSPSLLNCVFTIALPSVFPYLRPQKTILNFYYYGNTRTKKHNHQLFPSELPREPQQ